MDVIIMMLIYNEENNIKRALESILEQTIKPEIFIIDDASTDKTVEAALDVLMNSDLDFKIQLNPSNLGVTDSAITAFKAIQDRNCLVMRVDGDDELPPYTLNKLTDAYQHGKFVVGSYYEKTTTTKVKVVPVTPYSALACGVLMHTEDIKKSGGFARKEAGIFFEYDLYARMLRQGIEPVHVDDPVYIYYRHLGSITTSKPAVEDSLNSLRDLWGDEVVSQIRKY